jgi:hypothetical protein
MQKAETSIMGKESSNSDGKPRNPKHYENSTRNIYPLGKPKEVAKVHLRLITRFNGKRVI